MAPEFFSWWSVVWPIGGVVIGVTAGYVMTQRDAREALKLAGEAKAIGQINATRIAVMEARTKDVYEWMRFIREHMLIDTRSVRDRGESQ